MPAVLICGDTLRSPEMRHEVPLGIGDPFLYLEIDGRRAVLTNVLEVDRIAQQAPELERLLGEQFGRDELIAQGLSYEAIDRELYVRAVRELGIAAALVPPDFPLAVADRLRAEGIELTADDNLFVERRRRKTDAELAGIRRASHAAVAGVEECARVLREAEIVGDGLRYDGEVLTSEALRARIREVCARLGAPAPDDIIVAPMRPGDAVGHESGSGPLPAHAPICLDLWPQDEASGCWADMTRTWVRGDISDAVADLHRLVLEAHERSLAATRPGRARRRRLRRGVRRVRGRRPSHPAHQEARRDAPARLLLRARPRRRARGPRGARAWAHRPGAAHRRRRRRRRARHRRPRARRDARRGPGARHRRRLRAAHRTVVRSRRRSEAHVPTAAGALGRRSDARRAARRAGRRGLPRAVRPLPGGLGVLWAIRDDDGRIVDFEFGYGNPSIMRSFPPRGEHADRYTLLDALPRCAAALPSTPTSGSATTASPGCTRSPTTRPSATATCWALHPAHGEARRRPDRLPDRRDRPAADRGRAAQLRRHGRPRPARARHGDRAPRHAARAPRRRAALRRRPAPAAREHRAGARAHRRRARLRARRRAAAASASRSTA